MDAFTSNVADIIVKTTLPLGFVACFSYILQTFISKIVNAIFIWIQKFLLTSEQFKNIKLFTIFDMKIIQFLISLVFCLILLILMSFITIFIK